MKRVINTPTAWKVIKSLKGSDFIMVRQFYNQNRLICLIITVHSNSAVWEPRRDNAVPLHHQHRCCFSVPVFIQISHYVIQIYERLIATYVFKQIIMSSFLANNFMAYAVCTDVIRIIKLNAGTQRHTCSIKYSVHKHLCGQKFATIIFNIYLQIYVTYFLTRVSCTRNHETRIFGRRVAILSQLCAVRFSKMYS